MKTNLTKIILTAGVFGTAMAQTTVTGPSSSQSSYLHPLVASSTITSILTAGNAAGGYTMAGLPDGIGAFDNGNGSFTLLMNHEMGNTVGAVHAHGAVGAFVSKWVINKSNLSVVSGADLIQNLNLWTGTTYTTYNATTPSTLSALARFCSGDLPAVSAFYNAATGKGTQSRIYMNGEENGNEGRAFAHIATGPEAGNSYQLPYLGKASWENYVASPYPSDKTILIGLDDATPGQLYVYVGNKSSGGNELVKSGLTGGKLYGVAVLGLLNESSASLPAANTMFNLIDLGSVFNLTGATLNTNSNNVGVSNFLRPEDGLWDPSSPRDFYFVTTNSFTSPSRMWRLRFNDILNPESGGTITAVLDGTEGPKMMDNIGIDNFGHIMIQEDVGGNIHNGKIWQYQVANDNLTLFAQHDTTRFITGQPNFLTIDEEASGIIDAQEILGPGMMLFVDQAHYSVPSPVVEGGQLLALYNPNSANANPEINIQGNNTNITIGSTVTSIGNNTNFGPVNVGTPVIKTFVIQNSGPGVLYLKSVQLTGSNAGDFVVISPPSLNTPVAVNGTYTIYVQFTPAVEGTRSAKLTVNSNDFDEAWYQFPIEGSGTVAEINLSGNNITIGDGNGSVSTADNTDFGSTIYQNAITKTFVIQNSGSGTLSVSSIQISGNNSGAFTLINGPALPMSMAANSTSSFMVQYLPVNTGVHTATVTVNSSDNDESVYDFKIKGEGLLDVGIEESVTESSLAMYPNPADRSATLSFRTALDETVTVTVFDLSGKSVIPAYSSEVSAGEHKIEISTSNLAQGEYIVRLKRNNHVKNIRLIVAH